MFFSLAVRRKRREQAEDDIRLRRGINSGYVGSKSKKGLDDLNKELAELSKLAGYGDQTNGKDQKANIKNLALRLKKAGVKANGQ